MCELIISSQSAGYFNLIQSSKVTIQHDTYKRPFVNVKISKKAAFTKYKHTKFIYQRRKTMSAYKQIVIAVDLSDDSQKVCRRALEITKGNKVNILLVHVVEYIYQMGISYDPMFYPSMEDLSENEEQLIKSAKEKMAALIKEVPAPETVDLVSSVISGIPKTEILRLAEEKQADLIVCGSHGRSGFELLLGSTANAILHHAPCDVLAVRTKKVKE